MFIRVFVSLTLTFRLNKGLLMKKAPLGGLILEVRHTYGTLRIQKIPFFTSTFLTVSGRIIVMKKLLLLIGLVVFQTPMLSSVVYSADNEATLGNESFPINLWENGDIV